MIPLVVIRPEPGCSATISTARKMGLKSFGFPLFKIVPTSWEAPAPDSFDALLMGSANALRHGGKDLAQYARLPAYVVGEATAAAARTAGFAIALTGSGGLQAVLDKAAHPRLLRLSGEDHIALEPPQGITLTQRIVYASQPLPMPLVLAELLATPAVIMLHSAVAARHFALECQRLEIDRSQLSLAMIGPRVAEVTGSGWRHSACADEPSDHALLALARRLCQTAAS
jgi:uroporphyrinogen-III synthase